MRKRRIFAAAAALPLAMAGIQVAYADDISNNLDVSIDAVAESMPLNAGGVAGTTRLYVSPANGDGKNGCNLTGSTTLSVSIASADTSVATVAPSSLTFTSCSDTKTLTVTPVAQGATSVSATQTGNTTGATFDLSAATFNVTVSPATNTAPRVGVAGVTGGASYAKGTVPAATCGVTDAEDGNSSFPAVLGPVTGEYATDGIGSQTASCSYTDHGGLTASASETYAIYDNTAPTVGYTLNPATPDGNNGWYASNVALTWNVAESDSPSSLGKTGCFDQAIASDQDLTVYSCSATSAGGATGPVTVQIKRDATAPAIQAGAPSGTPGTSGWYTSAVSVEFTATDNTSGVATTPNPASASTGASEGASVALSSLPSFSDNAGNNAAATYGDTFKVDLTNPATPALSDGAPSGDVYFGYVPEAPICTSSDAVSGLKDCAVSGYSTAVGQHTLTATATDNAGRTSTTIRTYKVLPWTNKGFFSPVDMGGVLNTVKAGSTVPLKFELFAGSIERTEVADISSFKTARVNCDGTAPMDAIEILSTGGTSLRYDATGGQFIQNWKTPTAAGTCYMATMTPASGDPISALFKLK